MSKNPNIAQGNHEASTDSQVSTVRHCQRIISSPKVSLIKTLQAELDFVTPPWPKISAAAKDCVRQLLTVQVQSRPSASELLQVNIFAISCIALGITCQQI